MKALQVTKHGAPGEALEIRDVEKPEPGPGQVRIRVEAASLNFNDIDRCYGRRVTYLPPLPFTLGMDVCGEVDAAGPGGEAWVGRRVVALTQMATGGLAEYALAPADGVFEAPPGATAAEATTFLIPYQTMHLGLYRRGRLASGESLLVHAGASGLGMAAIQLGVARGARVFATAGGEDKMRLCRELGAELAIDSREDDFTERVLEATAERGVDVVCDLVAGPYTAKSWACTAREGRYLAAGFSEDPENGQTGVPLRPICTANIEIIGVMLGWVGALPPALRRAGFNPFPRDVGLAVHADLLRLWSEKQIRPLLQRTVALEETADALAAHEARRTTGRTAVVLGR
jgi:NADPH2:quinone reductase